MEIRHLRSFLAVARLQSFHKAAEHLHYAQSSISAQIRALETELDVRLFERLGRRIMLTEAGERLIEYAEKIVDLSDETRVEIGGGGEPEGSLTVRIPESLGTHRLTPVIRDFSTRFPKVRLTFRTCAHETLPKDLRKGVTDLAFLLAESIHSADVEVEALGFESVVLVASPDHRLARKALVKTRDLAGEPLLLSTVDCSYRRLLERTLREQDVSMAGPLMFTSIETLKRCVMAGVGISILPWIAVSEEVTRGKLSRLAWEEDTLEVAVLMIWYKQRWLSPTLKSFMDTAREVLNEHVSSNHISA
jgi:DNA-binding transcriptional LysR family regulator